MWLDGVPVVCYQETGPANRTFVLPQNSKPETENSVEEEQRHPLDTNIQSDLFTEDDSTNEVSFFLAFLQCCRLVLSTFLTKCVEGATCGTLHIFLKQNYFFEVLCVDL